MEKNLIGRLKVMKELGIKPNFSALQREFKVDRHTIKKYYDNDGIPIRKSVHRKSLWDPYEEEINDLMNKLGVTKKSVFYYMKNKYGDAFPGTYDGFKAYTLRKDIKCREESIAHVLYETDPGEQLQFDWKENIKIHLKNILQCLLILVWQLISCTLFLKEQKLNTTQWFILYMLL